MTPKPGSGACGIWPSPNLTIHFIAVGVGLGYSGGDAAAMLGLGVIPVCASNTGISGNML